MLPAPKACISGTQKDKSTKRIKKAVKTDGLDLVIVELEDAQ